MKLIKKGAEGDVYLTNWDNQKAILKVRKKKSYRNYILDEKIRKQRTIRESQIIAEVKYFGIGTPLIYQVDTKKCSILMQYVDGVLVRDLPETRIIRYCNMIGNVVGTLHKSGVMHGDLTTSNFIISKGKLFVIDFGLANKTIKPEDHAVDLRLFKEILNSAHADIMKKAWKRFLDGYKKAIGTVQSDKVMHLVSVIESRGRYATVT